MEEEQNLVELMKVQISKAKEVASQLVLHLSDNRNFSITIISLKITIFIYITIRKYKNNAI